MLSLKTKLIPGKEKMMHDAFPQEKAIFPAAEGFSMKNDKKENKQ